MKFGLLLAALILLDAGGWAKQHPVPLEKNTPDATCVECHQDKAKGKITHAAVRSGCSTCHAVRGSGENTRVVLKIARTDALCATCHADKQAPQARGLVHAPVQRDCLRCHDAHVSETKGLLRKATAGDKQSNLCLQCHQTGVEVPATGSRHAALDMGCETCHRTHKTGDVGNPEFRAHLTKTSPGLCVDCHDVKDEKLGRAHSGQPFAAADCTTCHDPHQSKSPKLMQAQLHQPFGDKACEVCHQPAQSGKVVLTQADGKALCVSCHEQQGKKIENAKVPHAGAQGDCTACHDPHAGRFRAFVRPDPVAACESCHPAQAELRRTKKALHPPVYSLACSTCHAPHGGENEHLLYAKGNDLCLACHGRDGRELKAGPDGMIRIFDNKVAVPAMYVQHAEHLALDRNGVGHPGAKHPAAGALDPSDPQKQRTISCARCHLPHAGETKLLVTNTASPAPLCRQCHDSVQLGVKR